MHAKWTYVFPEHEEENDSSQLQRQNDTDQHRVLQYNE